MRLNRMIVALAIAAALTVCSLGAAWAKDEIVIARHLSTGGMDPGMLKEAATIVDNIFDTLVLRDKNMKLVPGLAESWKALDDLTWQFKLRQGVKFHNGEPFTAAAVKFTIDRVLDPDNKAGTISYIRTFDHVDVVDDYTVNITTKAPDPLVPTRMSRYPVYIVPPKYVAEVGNEVFSREPVGTGPYAFVEWVKDDHITLKANESYWRGVPAIKKLTWRPIPEDSARVAALLTGEVDIIEKLPVDQVELVRKHPDTVAEQVKNGNLIIYLGLKMKEAPFDKKEVRQAISYAIDRQAIVDNILGGFAAVSGSQVGPYDFGYLKMEPYAYDPAKAKELLAKAGYPNGFEVDFQAARAYMKASEVGQAIAQMLGEVGIKVKLEVPEWTVYIQKLPKGQQAPLYMLGWGSTQTLDADAAIYAIYKSGEPYSTVDIPKMDELLVQSRKTIDAAAREKIFHEIQQLAYEEVPCVPLYQEDSLYGLRKNVDWKGRPDARIPVFDIRFK